MLVKYYLINRILESLQIDFEKSAFLKTNVITIHFLWLFWWSWYARLLWQNNIFCPKQYKKLDSLWIWTDDAIRAKSIKYSKMLNYNLADMNYPHNQVITHMGVGRGGRGRDPPGYMILIK